MPEQKIRLLVGWVKPDCYCRVSPPTADQPTKIMHLPEHDLNARNPTILISIALQGHYEQTSHNTHRCP